jgi:hypothetical protein
MENLTELSLEEIKAKLAETMKSYDNCIKNNLLAKARTKLPLINALEDEIAIREGTG